MAARVVDLPLPVGPVTKTSPLWSRAKVPSVEGRPSFSTVRILLGIWRKTPAIPFFCRKKLPR